MDSAGNLYVSDGRNGRVRRIDAETNVITTVAGRGAMGEDVEGGPAVNASLPFPNHVVVNADGHLYIADGSRVRRVDAQTGAITTVAGMYNPGFSGDGGVATECSMDLPASVAVDGGGNLVVADTGNNRVRRVAVETRMISTVAGSGNVLLDGQTSYGTSLRIEPRDIAVDAMGNVLIALRGSNTVYRMDGASGIATLIAGNGSGAFSGDGGAATAAGINPWGIAVDSQGDVYISDTYNYRVRRVDSRTGIITTIAGTGEPGSGGNGGPATAVSLGACTSVCVDARGDLLISEESRHLWRLDRQTGTITRIAGDGTQDYPGDGFPATEVGISVPGSLASHPNGDDYYIDLGFVQIRRINGQSGVVVTVAGNGDGYAETTEDGVPATTTGLRPIDIALDSAGNLYIADALGGVRHVDRTTNIITTLVAPSQAGPPGGKKRADPGFAKGLPVAIAIDNRGNVYFADDDSVRVLKGGAMPQRGSR
jgi:sugar lactone lactonase YvrE